MSNQVNTELIERAVELADATGDYQIMDAVAGYVHHGDLEGLYAYIKKLESARNT